MKTNQIQQIGTVGVLLLSIFLSACSNQEKETKVKPQLLKNRDLQYLKDCDQMKKVYELRNNKLYKDLGDVQFLPTEPTVVANEGPIPFAEEASDAVTVVEGNQQIQGIDELDSTKAIGSYIYRLEDSNLRVISRIGEPSELVQSFSVSESEMYHPVGLVSNGKKLIVFGALYEDYGYFDPIGGIGWNETPFTLSYLHDAQTEIEIKTYEILDEGQLKEIESKTIKGVLEAARLYGDDLYLVTSQYVPSIRDIEDLDIPCKKILVESSLIAQLEADEIVHEDPFWNLSELVCAHHASVDDLSTKPTCLTGTSASTVYLNQEHLFIAGFGWEEETPLHYFSLVDEEEPVKYINTENLSGNLLNQFSISEYKGYLRIAINHPASLEGCVDVETNGNAPDVECELQPEYNTVVTYLIDPGKNLIKAGETQRFGENETIYAVRFIRDKAFVVTFRRIDPLVTIDLSEPEAPRVMGELKITGYSDYLHPISDKLLLGVGREAEENGNVTGMLVSLFDISDMSDPKLLHKKEIGDQRSFTELAYNHNAFHWIANENMLVLAELTGNFSVAGFERNMNVDQAQYHFLQIDEVDGINILSTLDMSQNSKTLQPQSFRSYDQNGTISLLGENELKVVNTESLTTIVNEFRW